MCVDVGVDTCTSPGGSERQRICCMLHAVSCTRSCVYTQHLSVQHSHMNGVHHVRMSCVWRSCRAWAMHACCSAYVCCVCALHGSAVTRVCLHGMARCICVPPCRGCVVCCTHAAWDLHGLARQIRAAVDKARLARCFVDQEYPCLHTCLYACLDT